MLRQTGANNTLFGETMGQIEDTEHQVIRQTQGEVVAFKPSLNLTFSTVSMDRERLIACLHQPHVAGIYFDLSQVEKCNSAGLALLIEAKRLCLFYQKTFSIDTLSSVVADLVEFCGVKSILS